MPLTINAVPERISRDDYLQLLATVGLDAKDLMSVTFGPKSIDAVVVVRDEDGNKIIDRHLCEPATFLTSTISIPVTDVEGAEYV